MTTPEPVSGSLAMVSATWAFPRGGSRVPSAARVAICVATFHRPILLRALLQSLSQLRFSGHAAPELVLIVVDNDGARSAQSTVEEFSGVLRFPVVYRVEARRGIPHARNCAVRSALAAGADFVAFIDDDEVAAPDWLDELLAVQKRASADVVSGPALPRYAPGVPAWVDAGRFFHYPRYATGTAIPIAATNNVLISTALLAATPEPFDPSFGLSGMDDSHFFMRVQRAGARLVWADEARVEEYIPASKGRAGWILRRAFRIGNGYVFCLRALNQRGGWVVQRLLGASARVACGVLLLVVSPLRGRAAAVGALRMVANGLGSFVGLLGIRFEEYTTVHGS